MNLNVFICTLHKYQIIRIAVVIAIVISLLFLLFINVFIDTNLETLRIRYFRI